MMSAVEEPSGKKILTVSSLPAVPVRVTPAVFSLRLMMLSEATALMVGTLVTENTSSASLTHVLVSKPLSFSVAKCATTSARLSALTPGMPSAEKSSNVRGAVSMSPATASATLRAIAANDWISAGVSTSADCLLSTIELSNCTVLVVLSPPSAFKVARLTPMLSKSVADARLSVLLAVPSACANSLL